MILTPFPRRVGPISSPPPFAEANVASMKHFRLVDRAFLAQCIRKIREHLAQNFLAAPLLKAPMHGLLVRVALREHVPLRASVQDPQHRFQNSARRDRFATGTTVRNIFLRKVLANPLPLLIAQFQHAHHFTALH
jgi:hypothetical protein